MGQDEHRSCLIMVGVVFNKSVDVYVACRSGKHGFIQSNSKIHSGFTGLRFYVVYIQLKVLEHS